MIPGLIGGLIGLIFGAVITKVILHTKSVGSLRVDESDPYDGPYLFLELTTRPEVIKRKKYVTLEVHAKNYISHK